jgi:hypothetical protein
LEGKWNIFAAFYIIYKILNLIIYLWLNEIEKRIKTNWAILPLIENHEASEKDNFESPNVYPQDK